MRNYNAPQVLLLRAPLKGELALTKSKTEGYNAPKVLLLKPLLGKERWLDEVETERSNAPKAIHCKVKNEESPRSEIINLSVDCVDSSPKLGEPY